MVIPGLSLPLRNFLDEVIAGNAVRDWIAAVIAFAVALVVLTIVKRVLLARLGKIAERTTTDLDDLLVDLVRRTAKFFLVLLAIFVAHHWLALSATAEIYLGRIIKIALWIQVGLWGLGLLNYGMARMVRGSPPDDPSRTMGLSILGFIGRVILWSLVLLLCLQANDVPIAPLLASLGVGGIAVALAAQNILGDLFASITILLDKPFVIGDAIVLGEFQGTVERIGIKTTRLRSVSGEEIVIGNNDLVSSRVRNYKRMKERRQVFTVGVTYSTPRAKVARIPDTLREIIQAVPGTRFDRAHFKGFAPSSLDFEAVYFGLDPDLKSLMDLQQKINLEILARFEKEGIEFAFPTQTVYQLGPPAPPAAPQKELSRG